MLSRESTTRPATSPGCRCALRSAARRVASATAWCFRIAAGALFGPHQPVSLQSARPARRRMHLLEATRLELTDCAFPLLSELRLSTDPAEAFADADWIMLLAGAIAAQSTTCRGWTWCVPTAPIYVEHGQAINQAATDGPDSGRGRALQHQLPGRPETCPRRPARTLVRLEPLGPACGRRP